VLVAHLRTGLTHEALGVIYQYRYRFNPSRRGLAQYLFATNSFWAGNFVRISVP
jgi:hypothetical protein